MTVANPSAGQAPPAGHGAGEPRPASRGLVVAASILGALLSSGLALGVQYYGSVWQAERIDRITEVTKFIESAQQFDGLVTKFMGPFLAGGNDAAERQMLRDNIQLQHSLLDIAKTNLSVPQADRASRYQDLLVVVGEELDRSAPAPEAQALAQAISNARAANVCVVFDLRTGVGQPTTVRDQKDCKL
jgi:hypothetical protein